jgi:hypothetical protein
MKFITNHAERSSLFGFKHDGSLITFGRLGRIQVLSNDSECMGGFFKIQHPKMSVLAEMDKISREFHDWVEDTEDLEYDEVEARGIKLDKQLKAMSRQIPKDLQDQLKALLKVKRTPEEAGSSFSLLHD